ncbi:MAG: 1,4-dihydroxy-2-naphthoate polyprenyltransferase [Dehalococcoidia bacterium]|nr:MAG: 1,4-dihydroxy-2-naphthoate polyprenyltransferase [Dehalococcoidia bacterium]
MLQSRPETMTRSPRPSALQVWVLAIRWRTLSAAVAPILVGTGLAIGDGVLDALSAVAALFSALCIQIGTNLANDLHDFRRGADVQRVGPTRVVTAGLLSPRAAQAGIGVFFGLAMLFGLVLVLRGGWPIVVIGLASLLAGYAYTAGPFPLAYHGLGDLAAFLFFGVIGVTGMYYVQSLVWSPWAVLASLPVAALVTVILIVNNIRDIDSDRRVGKRTLAVLVGRAGARVELGLLLALAYGVPLVFIAAGRPWAALSLLTMPLAGRLASTVFRREDAAALNPALVRASQLLALHSALFGLGLAL